MPKKESAKKIIFFRRELVCITLNRVTRASRWCCLYTVFQSFGILGATKLPSLTRTIGWYCLYFLSVATNEGHYWWWSITLCRVVAIDLRGFNLSEKPVGKDYYKAEYVVADLKALIDHLSMLNFHFFLLYSIFKIITSIKPIIFLLCTDRKKCILVCHDWGVYYSVI